MKRSTYIYIGLLILIAGTAIALMTVSRNNTLPKDSQDFAVSDTAAINRIELSDRNNHNVVLTRQGDWMVNGRYKAQPSQIQTLLETIKQVQIKNPVSMQGRDNVIKMLAADAVKIKIYKKNHLVKTYFVGSPTPDNLGTIMLLNGAKEPYITYIPGFDGYLTTRYITKEQDWRSTEIYHLNPAEISMVSIEYPQQPDASFKLMASPNRYTLFQPATRHSTVMDMLTAKRYLAGFSTIDFENFIPFSQQRTDSLRGAKPFAVIQVKTPQENAPQLKMYYCTANETTRDTDKIGHDANRYYGILNDSHEVISIQPFVAGKLLATYADLKKD